MTDSQLELSSTEMPQLPEVIIDGQKVAGGSREALSEIYELINTANLARLRKLEESRIPTGTKSYGPIPLTTALTEVELSEPFLSMTLYNDGPAPIHCQVNKEDPINSEAPINVNQPFVVNFDYPTIIRIRMNSTANSTVRLFGKTGKVR